MSEIIKDISSPHWWVTVAVAGVLLNVFSSYLREWLDTFLARSSKRFRFWTAKKIGEFEKDIDRASKDITLMTFLAARQTGYHISALHNYVLGYLFYYGSRQVLSLPILSTVLSIFGLVFITLGAADFGRAGRCRTILDCVQRKGIIEPNPPVQPTPGSVTSPAAQEPRQP